MEVSNKLLALFLIAILSIAALALPVYASVIEDIEVTKEDTFYWEKDNNEWICTDEFGEPKTGWAVRDNQTYFLNKDGKIKTGWIKDKGNWYYLYSEKDDIKSELIGTLATNTWIDNYYVDKNGVQKKIKK